MQQKNLTKEQLINMPRRERRRVGKMFGIKIPGVLSTTIKKQNPLQTK